MSAIKKLKWNNLKTFKCPKCSCAMIEASAGERGVGCEDELQCGFYMRQAVFERVVNSLYLRKKNYKPKFGDDMQTLDLLNNLDNGVVPEGYENDVLIEPEDDMI